MTKATMGICGEIIINPIWGWGWHSSQKVILRWREALVPAASFSRYTGVLKFEIGHTVSFTWKKHDFVYAVSQVSFRFGYIEKSWGGGNFWYTGLITSGVMLYYHTLSRTLTKTVICMIAIWLKSGLPVSVELQTQDNDTDEFKIPHFFPTSKDTNVILRPYDIKKDRSAGDSSVSVVSVGNEFFVCSLYPFEHLPTSFSVMLALTLTLKQFPCHQKKTCLMPVLSRVNSL